MNDEKKLRYIQDSGHGWLEVPEQQVRDAGIWDEISSCSYINKSKGLVYLEEDCDMSLFLARFTGVQCEEMIREVLINEDCFVRRLESFPSVKARSF